MTLVPRAPRPPATYGAPEDLRAAAEHRRQIVDYENALDDRVFGLELAMAVYYQSLIVSSGGVLSGTGVGTWVKANQYDVEVQNAAGLWDVAQQRYSLASLPPPPAGDVYLVKAEAQAFFENTVNTETACAFGWGTNGSTPEASSNDIHVFIESPLMGANRNPNTSVLVSSPWYPVVDQTNDYLEPFFHTSAAGRLVQGKATYISFSLALMPERQALS